MNIDRRRIPPALVIGLFMAVTVGHVAGYVAQFEHTGSEWLGWPYALAVDLAIVVCSYFTAWATTRAWAWVGYGAFVAASGIMNVAYVAPWQRPDWWAAWVFALFPTAAVALAGLLYRRVDQLAGNAERRKERQRDESKPQSCGKIAAEIAPIAASTPEMSTEARRLALVDLWRANPHATFTELAPQFGVSRQTVSNDCAALAQSGAVRRNGNGVEVVA